MPFTVICSNVTLYKGAARCI